MVGLSQTPILVTADWIVPVSSPPIAGGGLLLRDGTVIDVGPLEEVARRHRDVTPRPLRPGAILPGLINAHTHLELATLERLRADDGFCAWIKRVIAAKEDLSPACIERGVREAIDRMRDLGTVYAADVANIFCTAPLLAEKRFRATLFQEFIGSDGDLIGESSFAHGFGASDAHGFGAPQTVRMLDAAHTPFSSGPELLAACARRAAEADLPWSLHLAESKDEVELLEKGTGPLRGLLLERGVAECDIPNPGLGPVAYVDSLGCLDERLIAVHCVEATADDFELLARRGVRPCVCPSSNLHLRGKLPDLDAMSAAGLEPCLGTDSTASGESLNLFREMEILLDARVDPAIILKMATEFGAAALRLGADFGRIEKGNRPALIHLACEFDRSARQDAAAAVAALIRRYGRAHDRAEGAIANGAPEGIAPLDRLVEELS